MEIWFQLVLVSTWESKKRLQLPRPTESASKETLHKLSSCFFSEQALTQAEDASFSSSFAERFLSRPVSV